MEAVQLDFINQLVPQPRANAPMSPEQKMRWLAEQTRHHLMPQYARLERLEELTKRKHTT